MLKMSNARSRSVESSMMLSSRRCFSLYTLFTFVYSSLAYFSQNFLRIVGCHMSGGCLSLQKAISRTLSVPM